MNDKTPNKADAMQPLVDENDWLAMQYVSGELTDEQAESFELAMVNDVSLCEAVLLATRLTSGIVLACCAEQSSRPELVSVALSLTPMPRSRPRLALFGVFAATAAMVLVVIGMMTPQKIVAPGEVVSADDAAAEMLALLLHNASGGDMNVEFDELSVADDSVSSLVAPEWLLTAVDLDSAGTHGELPVIGPDDESGVY
ncbi:MAG: hypothetical protein O2856_06440 [Planctomycetota bacterium]|nr:hypothetical protein [Planctomycetota bacterium]